MFREKTLIRYPNIHTNKIIRNVGRSSHNEHTFMINHIPNTAHVWMEQMEEGVRRPMRQESTTTREGKDTQDDRSANYA